MIVKGEDRDIQIQLKNTLEAQKEVWTLTNLTNGNIILDIDGRAYNTPFNTNIQTTITDFVNSFSDDLKQCDIDVDSSIDDALVFTARNGDKVFTVTEIRAGNDGTFTQVISEGFVFISSLLDMEIELRDEGNQLLNKYSLNKQTGFADIITVDSSGGIAKVILEGSTSVSADTGCLFADIEYDISNIEVDTSSETIKTRVFVDNIKSVEEIDTDG